MYKHFAFAVLALSMVVAIFIDDMLVSPETEAVTEEPANKKAVATSSVTEAEPDEYADEDIYDDYEEPEEFSETIYGKNEGVEEISDIGDNDEKETVDIIVDKPQVKIVEPSEANLANNGKATGPTAAALSELRRRQTGR